MINLKSSLQLVLLIGLLGLGVLCGLVVLAIKEGYEVLECTPSVVVNNLKYHVVRADP